MSEPNAMTMAAEAVVAFEAGASKDRGDHDPTYKAYARAMSGERPPC
jgi:hypothetical protein